MNRSHHNNHTGHNKRQRGGRPYMIGSNHTDLSLGVSAYDGTMLRIIDRGTPIPARKSQKFYADSDSEGIVEIHVVQGERSLAALIKFLRLLI